MNDSTQLDIEFSARGSERFADIPMWVDEEYIRYLQTRSYAPASVSIGSLAFGLLITIRNTELPVLSRTTYEEGSIEVERVTSPTLTDGAWLGEPGLVEPKDLATLPMTRLTTSYDKDPNIDNAVISTVVSDNLAANGLFAEQVAISVIPYISGESTVRFVSPQGSTRGYEEFSVISADIIEDAYESPVFPLFSPSSDRLAYRDIDYSVSALPAKNLPYSNDMYLAISTLAAKHGLDIEGLQAEIDNGNEELESQAVKAFEETFRIPESGEDALILLVNANPASVDRTGEESTDQAWPVQDKACTYEATTTETEITHLEESVYADPISLGGITLLAALASTLRLKKRRRVSNGIKAPTKEQVESVVEGRSTALEKLQVHAYLDGITNEQPPDLGFAKKRLLRVLAVVSFASLLFSASVPTIEWFLHRGSTGEPQLPDSLDVTDGISAAMPIETSCNSGDLVYIDRTVIVQQGNYAATDEQLAALRDND